MSATTATAASLITGKQIKDGSITGRDIKKGSISLNRLSSGSQKLIKKGLTSPSPTIGGVNTPGNQTETGGTGPQGAQGAAGANGTNGTNGANGTNGTDGAPGAAGRDAAGSVFLTAANMQGFTAPAPDACGGSGTGSQSIVGDTYQFDIGSDGDTYRKLNKVVDFKLADLSDLSYSEIVKHTGSGGQAPFLRIAVDPDGNTATNDDDALFFEPVYQDGSYTPLVSGAGSQLETTQKQKDGKWQRWDVLKGGVWTNSGNTGGPPLDTVDHYVSQHPDAKVTAIAIAAGCGGSAWKDFVGNVGDLHVGVGNVHPVIYQFDDGQN